LGLTLTPVEKYFYRKETFVVVSFLEITFEGNLHLEK
jgi:hypothetical protein